MLTELASSWPCTRGLMDSGVAAWMACLLACLLENSYISQDENTVVELPTSTCAGPIKSLVYIDDYNSIEKVKVLGSVSHYTTGRSKYKVLAGKSEALFQQVTDLAEENRMRVNQKKTQMLCIHSNKSCDMRK